MGLKQKAEVNVKIEVNINGMAISEYIEKLSSLNELVNDLNGNIEDIVEDKENKCKDYALNLAQLNQIEKFLEDKFVKKIDGARINLGGFVKVNERSRND
ncbi:hypothetical protein ABGF48_01410 [Helcococcus bovis]|uniref:hypothetical protein n=1 Tax=Helcococcus bovis TaxID=3153252 RepID=UPI0038B7F65F